jgi:hypothetical protein
MTLLALHMQLVPGLCADARVQPDSHPNHYIVVLDASFGMVERGGKNEAYRELIHSQLPDLLYERGFGPIPKLDPSQDYLTVLHFGIIGKAYSTAVAYRHLKEYRFTRDFIQRMVVRKKGIGAGQFSNYLPQRYFRYTFLSWARDLALAALEGSTGPANRTFLVFVTDGEPNGNSMGRGAREELKIAELWGDPEDIRRAKALVEKIEANYTFTDGAGHSDFAFRREFPASGDSVLFLEAHEVVSNAWVQWQRQAAQVGPPVSKVSATVRRQSGGDLAQFEGTLSSAASAWIDQLKPSSVAWHWAADGESEGAPCQNGRFLPLAAGLLSPKPCAPANYTLNATAQMVHADSLLGTRSAQVIISQVVLGPTPTMCTLWFYLVISGGILLAAGAGWFIVERFFSSDLRVCLPVLVTEIPLGRRDVGPATCPSIPRSGGLAFSVLLPPGWRQRWFYSGAVLSIGGPATKSLAWNGDQGQNLRLPSKRGKAIGREAFAFWQSEPEQGVDVHVHLVNGWRSGTVTLQFAYCKE